MADPMKRTDLYDYDNRNRPRDLDIRREKCGQSEVVKESLERYQDFTTKKIK